MPVQVPTALLPIQLCLWPVKATKDGSSPCDSAPAWAGFGLARLWLAFWGVNPSRWKVFCPVSHSLYKPTFLIKIRSSLKKKKNKFSKVKKLNMNFSLNS